MLLGRSLDIFISELKREKSEKKVDVPLERILMKIYLNHIQN